MAGPDKTGEALSLDGRGVDSTDTGYLDEDLSDIAETAHELGLGCSSICVTGATGLIGSILVKGILRHNQLYQAQPIKVFAGCRNANKATALFGERRENLTVLTGGIAAGASLSETCDYIIHLACPTSSKVLSSQPVEVISAIVDVTRDVLEAARTCGAKSIVYVSSMEAFGQVCGDRVSREEDLGYIDLQSARSCYPEGKRLAELLAYCYFEEYGVPAKVVRLAQSFGAGIAPDEGRVFAQFARSAVAGEDIVLHTKGKSVGNYCYLADAVRGLLYVLAEGEPGEVYAVANGEMTMTIAEMAHLVAGEISRGRSQVAFDVPEDNKYGYAADTELRMDASKLRGLGWTPRFGMAAAYQRMLPSLTKGIHA